MVRRTAVAPPAVVTMHDLSQAKFSFVTRTVNTPGTTLSAPRRRPVQGDVVVTRVVRLGQHRALEDRHGRRVRLYPGDLVVGAYGNRYATDFYEGYVPTGPRTHLLTAGGLIGTVASADARRGPATELEVVGVLAGGDGSALNLADFDHPVPPAASPPPATVVVVGSSMNAGKTTTVAGVIRGWTRAGLVVGAGKATGSGSGKDRWVYIDAGAHATVDFLDFGMPSTFGYPTDHLVTTMQRIRDALAAAGATHVVIEIADGLLQPQTRELLGALPGFADAVLLAVGDALGAVGAQQVLASAGIAAAGLSGLVSRSPLAAREAEAATGLPVLSPEQLAEGAVLDLLAAVT
ncbi:MAG: hypothetical protein JWR70_242 [Modestobacter sp.]|nr:hypothetical protein [Modestobacter sp.]